MPIIPDKGVFEKNKRGDSLAFKQLFDSYYPQLCNYACVFVKFPEIAEEIVQETFIRLWENRSTLEIETSLKAYLYKAVHNHSLNYLKSANVKRRHTEQMLTEIKFHQELAVQNFSDGILDKLITDELEYTLNESINNLPEQCRNIFQLSRQEQLTYQQIADNLSISVNTVKTQMQRALEKLRETLKK